MCDELSENLNIYSKIWWFEGIIISRYDFCIGIIFRSLIFKKCFLKNLWMKWYDFWALFLSNSQWWVHEYIHMIKTALSKYLMKLVRVYSGLVPYLVNFYKYFQIHHKKALFKSFIIKFSFIEVCFWLLFITVSYAWLQRNHHKYVYVHVLSQIEGLTDSKIWSLPAECTPDSESLDSSWFIYVNSE